MLSFKRRPVAFMQALRPFTRSWLFWLCCVVLASPAWLGGWHQLHEGDRTGSRLRLRVENLRSEGSGVPGVPQRRLAAVALALSLSLAGLSSARALIKGNTPPKDYGLGKGLNKAGPLDCRSRTECEEMGLKREEEKYGNPNSQEKTYKLTSSGARYKDMKPGNESDGVVKVGDDLKIRYRVMRSGKRSYDGLSGEATTLFSLGYGEDDGPKDATLNAPIGQGRFVKALDEGLVGMAVGGVRRVQVRPDYGLGWKKEGKCAEAIGAVGVVAGLPAAGAERESACLDDSLLPQPIDWDAKRRFERRFDEGLIVEVELMGLGK